MRAHRFSALRGYSNALLISLDSLSSCPGLSLESSLTFLRRDTKSRDKQECKCEKTVHMFFSHLHAQKLLSHRKADENAERARNAYLI